MKKLAFTFFTVLYIIKKAATDRTALEVCFRTKNKDKNL